MRVISQDGTCSVDFDHMAFWCQSHCIYAKVGNENALLAAYKTDDRMKEVFQEMHSAKASLACVTTYYLPEE